MNWREHFRRSNANSDFGTIGGFYTGAELSDLIRAHESVFNTLAHSIATIDASQNPPSAAWQDFKHRWDSFVPGYTHAIAAAKDAASSFFPNLPNTDSQYRDLVRIDAPLADFDRELRQKFSSNPVYNVPQPGAPDTDLSILVEAQKATSHIVDPMVGDTSLDPKKQIPITQTSEFRMLAIGAGIAVAAILGIKVLL